MVWAIGNLKQKDNTKNVLQSYLSMSINYVIVLIALISFLGNAQIIRSQNVTYNHHFISMEDGLASREVLCGLQDHHGFLWFGTRNGLNRYDGNRFKLLTKHDGLKLNRIVSLAEDTEGNIWICYGNEEGTYNTNGKIDIYSPVTGELISLDKKFMDVPFKMEDINFMIPTKRREIYFLINDNQVYKYNSGTGFNLVFNTGDPDKLKLMSNYIPNASDKGIEINDSYIFYGSQFQEIKKTKKSFSYFNEEGLLECVSLDATKKFNQLIIEKYKQDGQKTIEYKLCDSLTYAVLNNFDFAAGQWRDRFGSALIIPVKNALYLFKNYKCIELINESKLNKGILSNLSFFSDRQNNYWICGFDGIHKFTPKKKRFQVYFNKQAIATHDRVGNQIRGIYADSEGNIWAGGHFGLLYYDFKKSQYFKKLGTTDHWVHCIDERDNKLYLFGTGFRSLNLSDMKVSENYVQKMNLSRDLQISTIGFIWAIYPLSGGRFLLGNDLGKMLVWNANDYSYKLIEACNSSMPFSNYIYRIIYSVKDQHYWAVGGSGCYRISNELCITDYYGVDNLSDKHHAFSGSEFRDIYEDHEGIFWIATNGDGLLKWNRANDSIQLFSIQDGMPSNTLYCILEDDFEKLWISTDNGLVCFDKRTNDVKIYSKVDGIAHNEFNRISSFKDPFGKMYFGGINGLTSFDPKDFQTDTLVEQIPLQVTSYFQFLGSSNILKDLTHQLLVTKKIVLHPGDNFFKIEFALLDYSYPVKGYRYRIEGLEEGWQYFPEPSLRLGSLPYGDYVLQISGQSYSGKWSQQELSIPIHVLRPWYFKWWAYLVYLFFFLSFLNLIRKYQIKRILENAERIRLKEIDLLKTKLYTNITHEFRNPLTVIMGITEQLTNVNSHVIETKDGFLFTIKEKAHLIQKNAGHMLELINQLLDLSKLDSGKLEVNWETGDIIFFLEYIWDSYHSYAESKNIQLTFYSEFKSIEMDFDRDKLQKVISNILGNALKFTPQGGKIVYHVSMLNEIQANVEAILQIKISDSGVGISQDHLHKIFDRFYQVDDTYTRRYEGTGIGLALTKELTELMGGVIEVNSELNRGTIFILRFPIKKSKKTRLFSNRSETKIQPKMLHPVKEQEFQVLDSELLENESPLILIVEDNLDVAKYIRDCMANKYSVLLAGNGQSGIEMAIQYIPDIIISDVMMPEKDGYELTKYLKNDERTSHIPIILLTAKVDIGSKIIGLERGADAYLSKPFDQKELLTQIANLIELRSKLQAHYSKSSPLNIQELVNYTIEEDLKQNLKIEDAFLSKLNDLLEKNYTDSSFGVPQIAFELKMSHSQLFRKIKALTNKSIVAYLRSFRLQKGKNLLQTTTLNISEIAFQTGYNDPAYFSRVFLEEFGISPIDCRK